MRRVFTTEDGKIWDNEKEAMKHELTISKDLLMYDRDGSATIRVEDAITVNIRTQAGLRLFRQAYDLYDLEEPDEVEEPGIYGYDDEIYTWMPMKNFSKSLRALFSAESTLQEYTKEEK